MGGRGTGSGCRLPDIDDTAGRVMRSLKADLSTSWGRDRVAVGSGRRVLVTTSSRSSSSLPVTIATQPSVGSPAWSNELSLRHPRRSAVPSCPSLRGTTCARSSPALASHRLPGDDTDPDLQRPPTPALRGFVVHDRHAGWAWRSASLARERGGRGGLERFTDARTLQSPIERPSGGSVKASAQGSRFTLCENAVLWAIEAKLPTAET